MADKVAVYHCPTKAGRAHTEDEKDMDQISSVGRMNQPRGNRLRTLGVGYREEGEVLREKKKLVDGYKPSVEVASGSQELEVEEVAETLAQVVEPNLAAKP